MCLVQDGSNFNFSVLMSLYYKESPEYLDECLNSLHQQTLPANEIVLVLDGKINNELAAKIEKWKVKLPIRVVALEHNVGLGQALNIGLSYCSYQWVARMDTDDISTKFRFEMQIKYLMANPEVKLLGGKIEEFHTSPEIVSSTRFSCVEHDAIGEYSKRRSPFNHMTVIFDKFMVIDLGGYKHHLFMEDYNLWLRILSSGVKVANIDKVLVKARIGNGMLERRRGWRYIKSEILLAKLKKQLKIDSEFNIIIVTIVRIIPRMLPVIMLRKIYKFLR